MSLRDEEEEDVEHESPRQSKREKIDFGEDPCRAPVLCQFAPRDDLHSNVDEVSGVTLLGWGFAKLNVTSYKTMVFYTYDCNLSNFV